MLHFWQIVMFNNRLIMKLLRYIYSNLSFGEINTKRKISYESSELSISI